MDLSSKKSQEYIETYLTRVPPDKWESAGAWEYSISKQEWDAFVGQHPDLEADKEGKYRLKSYPEGMPLIYEDGRILLRKDDSVTLEKMVEMAKALDAYVIDENGRVFESVGGEQDAEISAGPASHGTVIIATEEERMRRRQIMLLIALLMICPLVLVVFFQLSEVHVLAVAAAIVCTVLAVWSAIRMCTPRYALHKEANGRLICYRLNTKSGDDRVVQVELDRDKARSIELVWHPLKYASRTFNEFQVRMQNYPWLVLMTSYKEQRAKKAMQHIAHDLRMIVRDRTHEGPAKDIPQSFQLTKEEMGSASPMLNWTVFLVIAAAAAAAFFLGDSRGLKITGIVLGAIALLFPIVFVLKFKQSTVSEKCQKWLDQG